MGEADTIVGEADTIRNVWQSALAIVGMYPLATLVPAAFLGALGEAPTYLMEGHPWSDQIVTLVTAYVAYYLYLAYAEGLVRRVRRGAQRHGLGGVLDDMIEAAPFVPSVLVAALITGVVTAVGILLLVVPGLWLYTRWSLTAPVIREEDIGPLAAIRRSHQLVRGHFWFVFATATVAYYMEGVVIHYGALVARWVTQSHTWGEWVGGTIVATIAMPLVAFATSLAHSSVVRQAKPVRGDSRANVGLQ